MHVRSVICGKKKSEYYWKATEWWLNGTEWSLNGHWNEPAIQSTEWWLKGHWIAPFNFNGMVAFRLECRDRNLNTQPSTCKTNVLNKWDTAMANKEDIKSNNAFSRFGHNGYVLPQEPLSSQLIFMCNLSRISWYPCLLLLYTMLSELCWDIGINW